MAWGGDEPEEPIVSGSETRLLILSYATGDFAFEILEAIKDYWAEGEQIKVHYKVKNNGNVDSTAKIDVYDDETGDLLCTFSISSVPVGYSFEATDATHYKLKMPAEDWTLRFELTP